MIQVHDHNRWGPLDPSKKLPHPKGKTYYAQHSQPVFVDEDNVARTTHTVICRISPKFHIIGEQAEHIIGAWLKSEAGAWLWEKSLKPLEVTRILDQVTFSESLHVVASLIDSDFTFWNLRFANDAAVVEYGWADLGLL